MKSAKQCFIIMQIFKLCDIVNAQEIRFESNSMFFEDKKQTFLTFDEDK